MAKSWTTKRRGDEKDFLRSLSKGKTVYVINTPQHAGKAHLWNHAQTWSAHTVTGKHPLIGGWQIGNNTSAETFFRWAGTVYDTPPAGIPHDSDPGPDCRDEGLYGIGRGQEFKGNLQDGEKEMRRLAIEAAQRKKADNKSGARKGWW
ncbi:hypothetical protein ACFWNR_06360 [Streptomyces virginiae]|uniref:hypothetical protein n=1 Tax=Streptomyces virginiae TaxID=1961 RepID=UPI003655137F